MHFIILFYHMLIYNLHCQLVLRISGNTNMLDKNTSNTSVSSGQLNDDDHCLLVRAKLKKIMRAHWSAWRALWREIQLKTIKPLKCFYCQWLPKKNATSVVANRRRAGIALLRILWKTWKIVFMWKHRAMMRACLLLVAEIWRGGDVVATNRGKNIL